MRNNFVYAKNSFTYSENDDGSGVRYLTDIKPNGFQSHLEVFRGSSPTEELRYNERVCLWMTIYIMNKSFDEKL